MKVWIGRRRHLPRVCRRPDQTRSFRSFAMQGIVATRASHSRPARPFRSPCRRTRWSVRGKWLGPQHLGDPMPKDGHLTWTAPNTGSDPYTPNFPLGRGVRAPCLRSFPTRLHQSGRRAPYSKDALYPMIDYLDPTHAAPHVDHPRGHTSSFGADFGHRLGFFGDEPDYAASIPWTPALLMNFASRKVDLQP